MSDNINNDDKLLSDRVGDAVEAARSKYSIRYIGFLDEHGVSVATKATHGWCGVSLWGGYDEADRVLMAVYPDYVEVDKAEFPLRAITVTARKEAKLTHRDWLGSLMSLGIRRDAVGDILTDGTYAVIFLTDGVADYVLGQLDRVGGEGVKLCEGFTLPLPGSGGFEDIRCTVASARLDCVVGALCSVSRGNAAELIESGAVAIDSSECLATSRKVSDGQRISIRGKGKFIIDSTGDVTRKGRIVLCARKYI